MARKKISLAHIGADTAIDIGRPLAGKNEKLSRVMNLRRDGSRHRRFAYIYGDMLK